MAVGKSVRFTVDVAINQDLKALIPRPTLSADFLHAWLHGHEAEIAASATGSTVKGIRVGHLEGMHLLLPPLPEQKKIAAILSSVDEAIQATQLVIEQTRRVKEGLLQDLLTRGLPGHERFKQTVIGEIPESWEVVHLQQACSHIVDCPHSTPVYEEDGVPCIRTADLDRDGLHVERAFRVSEATYATRTVRLIPELGDIIYSREGERFGIAAPVGHERVCLGQRVMQFRAAEDMVPKFLLAVLNSASVYQQAASCVGSTTAPHVNIEDIRRFRIPKPPYPEQAAIADAVEPLIVTIREGKEQLPALHRLKAGLLQDLLTGKVRVSP
jgi:type I restriction enzyme S subunit